MPVNSAPTFSCTSAPVAPGVPALRSSSDSAKAPIMVGIMLMPDIRSTLPKVKRGCPATGSMPTVPTPRPISSDTRARTLGPLLISVAQLRPRQASQKYSNDEKLSAASASSGANAIRHTTPTSPPSTENTRLAPRFSSSWPLRAMA